MKEKIQQGKQVLSEKEKRELEILDNPNIKYLTPSGGFFSIILDSLFHSSSRRKERVVYLRTKIRINELGIDIKKERQRYYEIREEEQKRFDERFKDYKKYL